MMETNNQNAITIQTTVNAPVQKVWNYWTQPEHITKWAHASADWHTPYADNDLRTDGKFKTTMAARDGSFSFDFEGIYTGVDTYKLITYTMADGRSVSIIFEGDDHATTVIETFDPEQTHSLEMQRSGWQAILDNFKLYTENN